VSEQPPARRRHVKSTVDRLKPELRDEILRLRLAEGRTIDEIYDRVRIDHGVHVTRSALGRHVLKLEVEMEERKQAELAKLSPALAFANALAAQIVAGFKEAGGTDKLDASAHLLEAQILQMAMSGMGEGEGRLGPKEMFVIARSLQTLEQAKRTKEIRAAEGARRAAEAAKKEAAARVDEVVKKAKGLTAETVQAIRHAVLGDA
jgi:hypothetical protein